MSGTEALAHLTTAVGAVDQVPLQGVPEQDLAGLLRGLDRVERQQASRRLATLAELDRRHRDRGDDTGRAARAQLTRQGLTTGQARRALNTANMLDELPATRDALEAGQISEAHAEEIAKAAEQVEDSATKALIDARGAATARTTNVRRLRRVLEELIVDEEPDTAEAQEARAIRNRSASTYDAGDGMVGISAKLPRHQGEAVRTVLSVLSRPHSANDERTFVQRQADALFQLALWYLNSGGAGEEGGYVPHISLIVDLSAEETGSNATPAEEGEPPVTGDLAHSGVVSERMIKRLGCDAHVARVVATAPGRILNVGRAHRTATTAQRRALAARDRGCIGCHAPPGWCQAHHIKWWRHGGRTDIDNLALVCWSCHDKIHHLGWTVHQRADGSRTLLPPPDEGNAVRHQAAA